MTAPRPAVESPLRPRPLTVAMVRAMADAGSFSADERLELLDGVLCTMPPIGPEHAFCSDEIDDHLRRHYGAAYTVRVGNPVSVSPSSEPQPDLVVARGPRSTYHHRHPTPDEIVLAVEVAQSSLDRDRVKAGVYARAGVARLWIVDLASRRVEVHSDPREGAYGRVEIVSERYDLELPEVGGTLSVGAILPA